jgi:aminoglycoside 6-adenylyltransferase
MIKTYNEEEVISSLVNWAKTTSSVSAMLLTSTRAIPTSDVDWLSDYDVILIVRNIHPFNQDRVWLQEFGDVLVSYWDPIYKDAIYNLELVGNVIQYSDGLRIDFTLWPLEYLEQLIQDSRIIPELDAGFRVLYDTTSLTQKLPPSTHKAYIPIKPSEEEFHKVIEDFYSDVPYAAKCLVRHELLPLKWCLDYDMKHLFLRKMLEWKYEIECGWSRPVGAIGKGLTKKLGSQIVSELEETYAGAGVEENWEALFATVALFKETASEIASKLGYSFPGTLDQRVIEYARELRIHKG